MCLALDPVTMFGISLGLSAVQGITQYAGEQQRVDQENAYRRQVYEQQVAQARQQQEYQNALAAQQNQIISDTTFFAKDAALQDYDALQTRMIQEESATALDIQQKRIERLKAVGALASSERAGLSLQGLMQDFYRQEGLYGTVANQNLANVKDQMRRQGEGVRATTMSRVGEARAYIPSPVPQPMSPNYEPGPNFLGTALKIAGDGLSAYGRYSAYDYDTKNYRLSSGMPKSSSGWNISPPKGVTPYNPKPTPLYYGYRVG